MEHFQRILQPHCQKTRAKPKSPHENFLISFLGIGTVETFTWIRENEELQDKEVIAWVHSHVQGKFILILRDLCFIISISTVVSFINFNTTSKL